MVLFKYSEEYIIIARSEHYSILTKCVFKHFKILFLKAWPKQYLYLFDKCYPVWKYVICEIILQYFDCDRYFVTYCVSNPWKFIFYINCENYNCESIFLIDEGIYW